MAMLPKADVVLRGGRVFVAYGAPVAEAIALWSGKVLAVGSSSDMEPLIGPATRVIELRGRLATPGLFEAHAHLLPMGLSMAEVDARPQNANTLDGLLDLIREAAAKRSPANGSSPAAMTIRSSTSAATRTAPSWTWRPRTTRSIWCAPAAISRSPIPSP